MIQVSDKLLSLIIADGDYERWTKLLKSYPLSEQLIHKLESVDSVKKINCVRYGMFLNLTPEQIGEICDSCLNDSQLTELVEKLHNDNRKKELKRIINENITSNSEQDNNSNDKVSQ